MRARTHIHIHSLHSACVFNSFKFILTRIFSVLKKLTFVILFPLLAHKAVSFSSKHRT